MREPRPDWLTVTETDDQTVWFSWEPEETPSPAVAVVEAVATAKETSQHALSPLYDAVDPAHLSTLLEDASDVRVEFVEWDCRVVVEGDDTIAVTPGWPDP